METQLISNMTQFNVSSLAACGVAEAEDLMKRIVTALLLLCLSSGAWAQKAKEPLKLKAGDTAPDFTLLAFDGKDVKPVSLHDFKGKKNVALAFYVFAFTGG